MNDSSWIDDPKNTAKMDEQTITNWSDPASVEAFYRRREARLGTGCTCSSFGPSEAPSRRPLGLRDALCPLHGNAALARK